MEKKRLSLAEKITFQGMRDYHLGKMEAEIKAMNNLNKLIVKGGEINCNIKSTALKANKAISKGNSPKKGLFERLKDAMKRREILGKTEPKGKTMADNYDRVSFTEAANLAVERKRELYFCPPYDLNINKWNGEELQESSIYYVKQEKKTIEQEVNEAFPWLKEKGLEFFKKGDTARTKFNVGRPLNPSLKEGLSKVSCGGQVHYKAHNVFRKLDGSFAITHGPQDRFYGMDAMVYYVPAKDRDLLEYVGSLYELD